MNKWNMTFRAIGLTATVLIAQGCMTVNVCDRTTIGTEYEHVSHPLAGWPQGDRDEEDALHQLNGIGRCEMGRGYVEGGVGWKVRNGGFYGPEMTGTIRVGVRLWESK